MADQGSEGLLSPWLRKQRFKAALPYLKGNVLDFGCGSGMLAEFVDADFYLGVEVDEASLQQACSNYSSHHFTSKLPDSGEKFDTILALAVIEHINNPAEFLARLSEYLNLSSSAHIVLTTPHPSVDWIHGLGAKIGLFSQHANEEHEELLDRQKLEKAGKSAGMRMISYKRFLFGANQIAVFSRM